MVSVFSDESVMSFKYNVQVQFTNAWKAKSNFQIALSLQICEF